MDARGLEELDVVSWYALGRIAEQFGMEIPHESQHPGVSAFLFDRRTAA